MDQVTRTDLEDLAQRDRPGVHISLFIPTDRFGTHVPANRLAWKNLLNGTESALSQQGMRPPDIAELLTPAWELHDDAVAWQYMADGLAFFLRPGRHRRFRVPVRLPGIGAIGDRFIIGPLLSLVASDRPFLVLTLSRQRIRLLEGNLQKIEEMELRDVPTSLRDVIEPQEPTSDAVAWPVAAGTRGGGRAVFYGHGAAEKDHKKEETRQYLYRVADGIQEYLGGRNLPMVPVGLDYLVAMYREVNGYPHLTEEAVLHNPDELSAEDLHAAAWPVVERIAEREASEARRRFRELRGTGRASDDPEEIERSARHGLVDTLFLGDPARCWEELSSGVPVVRLGRAAAAAHCERLDRTAADTLTHAGQIFVASSPQAVDNSEIAAIFRY